MEINKKSDSEARTQDPEKRRRGSRRAFFKKAAYATPVLMAMGQLAKPEKVHADVSGGPDGTPTTWIP